MYERGAGVIIWLNGTFGSGKTQTAAELHRRIPDSYVFDPENAGIISVIIFLLKWQRMISKITICGVSLPIRCLNAFIQSMKERLLYL
ncbi:hypothetical protein NSU18_27040 [Paenibacillus sp. FSL H8-0048]|uniref:hypothetical protein n=1 Tax=Paenibacillus sp. FSL H8-0048 TaxID=2954508 RepID=UPI0030FCEBD8